MEGTPMSSPGYCMRTLLALPILCGLLWPAPALADQRDPRLGQLFAQLKAMSEPMQAIFTEQQIWAIWLEPPDEASGPHMEAGVTAMNRGDHAAALKAFDRAVKAAPEFAEAWNKRATVHYLAGNLDQSLRDIEKTLALEPRHFGALSGRGLVYAQMGELENALQAFEAALAVHPQMTGARINAEGIRALLQKREI